MNHHDNTTPPPALASCAAPAFEDKKQLARRIGVSVRTIDNLLDRGLPHIKVTNKLTRFPRADVDQWLRDRTIRRN
jgi:excisionase family DNA binding protein